MIDTPPSTRPRSWLDRIATLLGTPCGAIGAGLLVLASLHYAVTTLRSDRGWSQSIPEFGLAALLGLGAATLLALIRRRPLADARAFVAIVAIAIVFAYFAGKVALVPSITEHGRPPEFFQAFWFVTIAVAAVLAWVVPVRPLEGMLFAALVLSTPATRVLMRWAPDGFDVAPIALALAAVAHARLAERDRPWSPPPFTVPVLGFTAAVAFSGCFSSNQQIAVPAVGRTIVQACAFLAAADALRHRKTGRWVLAVLAAVSAVVAAGEVWSFALLAEWAGLNHARLTRLEPFGIHPNLVAPFSAIGAVACFGALFCLRSWIARIAALLGAAVCALSVYLQHSGGATAALVAGCAVVVLAAVAARWRHRLAANAIGLGLAALPIALVAIALVYPLFKKPMTGGGEAGRINVGTRVEFWKAASRAILAHPIAGLGPKNVEAHTPYVDEAIEANVDWSNHPHNLYLEVGETLGLPGLLAFLAMFVAAGLAIRRALAPSSSALGESESGDRWLAVAGAGLLAAIAVDAFFDHGFSEFAVVPDSLWWALLLVASATPAVTRSAGASARWSGAAGLSIAATIGLVVGGLLPLACTALDRSAAWIHFWNTNAKKFDNFTDPVGRSTRIQWLLRLAPYRSDVRIWFADGEIATRHKAGLVHVERSLADSPFTSDVVQHAALCFINDPLPEKDHDYARGLELYRSALKLGNPEERGKARLGYARCLFLTGKKEAAMDELGDALATSPTLPITVVGFRVIDANPATGQAADYVYRCAPAPGQYLSVLTALQRASDRIRPQLKTQFDTAWGPFARIAEAYTNCRRADLALAQLEELASVAPPDRMMVASALAQARTNLGQFERALEDLNRAEAAAGRWHPMLSALRAKAFEGMKRYGEARDESARFIGGAFDLAALRLQARDAFRRAAYAFLERGDALGAARAFGLAARCEDSLNARLGYYFDAANAALRGYVKTSDRAHSDAMLEYFDDACAVTGLIEWGEFDGRALMDRGRELAISAGSRVRMLFAVLAERVLDHAYAPGPYLLLAGFGDHALERARQEKDGAAEMQLANECERIVRTAASLYPRVAASGAAK